MGPLPGLDRQVRPHFLDWDSTTVHLLRRLNFSRGLNRVIALDLRGHGESDIGEQEYAMPILAEDVAWLCAQLKRYRIERKRNFDPQ